MRKKRRVIACSSPEYNGDNVDIIPAGVHLMLYLASITIDTKSNQTIKVACKSLDLLLQVFEINFFFQVLTSFFIHTLNNSIAHEDFDR